MTDTERLSHLVDIWWGAARDVIATLGSLAPEDWARPTDLPGWDVRAVAAHLAHVESLLAGEPQERIDAPAARHIRSPFGAFMESGVIARQSRAPAELIAEFQTATTNRHDRLLADPPSDPRARPGRLPPGIDWDTETLLANRAVDVWMHEQDVRRAVGRPVNLTSAAADHTAAQLATSLAYVVARQAAAPPGTTVSFALGGHPVGVRVDERGRGSFEVPPGKPDLAISLSREQYLLAAGGRVHLSVDEVAVEGDRELATRILQHLAVTP